MSNEFAAIIMESGPVEFGATEFGVMGFGVMGFGVIVYSQSYSKYSE